MNYRQVTRQQYAAGYFVMIDGVIYHRNYVRAIRTPAGRNEPVTVHDPFDDYESASKLLEECYDHARTIDRRTET